MIQSSVEHTHQPSPPFEKINFLSGKSYVKNSKYLLIMRVSMFLVGVLYNLNEDCPELCLQLDTRLNSIREIHDHYVSINSAILYAY